MKLFARAPFAGLLTALVTLAPSCGESGSDVPRSEFVDYVVEQGCAAYFECACNEYGDQVYSSMEGCVETGRTFVEDAASQVEAAGLIYDPSCPTAYVDTLDELACSNDWYRANQTCEVCKIFHGEVPEGSPCENLPEFSTGGWSTCAQGLVCANDGQGQDVCVNPCTVDRTEHLEAGEVCQGAEFGECLLDLACGDAGVCEPAPALGEPCPDGRCSGAYCDQSAPDGPTCVALLPNGTECEDDRQCETRDCRFGLGTAVCDDPIPRTCFVSLY